MTDKEKKELILQVRNVSKVFSSKGVNVRAVTNVSFDVHKGETIGIVGESGCGKTTLGRCIVRAIDASQGEVIYKTLGGDTVNFLTLDKQQMKPVRKEIQMIFQDPYSSLDPRMTVLDIIGEPLKANYPKKSYIEDSWLRMLYWIPVTGLDWIRLGAHAIKKMILPESGGTFEPKWKKRKSESFINIYKFNKQRKKDIEAEVKDIAAKVGLNTTYLMRYPHAFSGGQRQRIGIARALILKPQVIVCDEAVSALDVSIQAQIINLLKELQRDMELTYIFISHDLSVVEHISDKVGVMYLGKMVEFGETEKLFASPKHPYTEALLSAVPVADPDVVMDRIPLKGEIPNPANPPSGCYFHERCRYCTKQCETEVPELHEVDGRMVACHHAEELHLRGFNYDEMK